MFKLLIFVILSSATWITAVVQWFQYDDHVALGFLGLSMVLSNYAASSARTYVQKQRGF